MYTRRLQSRSWQSSQKLERTSRWKLSSGEHSGIFQFYRYKQARVTADRDLDSNRSYVPAPSMTWEILGSDSASVDLTPIFQSRFERTFSDHHVYYYGSLEGDASALGSYGGMAFAHDDHTVDLLMIFYASRLPLDVVSPSGAKPCLMPMIWLRYEREGYVRPAPPGVRAVAPAPPARSPRRHHGSGVRR